MGSHRCPSYYTIKLRMEKGLCVYSPKKNRQQDGRPDAETGMKKRNWMV